MAAGADDDGVIFSLGFWKTPLLGPMPVGGQSLFCEIEE